MKKTIKKKDESKTLRQRKWRMAVAEIKKNKRYKAEVKDRGKGQKDEG